MNETVCIVVEVTWNGATNIHGVWRTREGAEAELAKRKCRRDDVQDAVYPSRFRIVERRLDTAP